MSSCLGWLYFRKPAADVTEENEGEIFSDTATKIDQLQSTAEEMPCYSSLLCSDSNAARRDALDVVEAYTRENTTVLADPLSIQKKNGEFKERRDDLLFELNTRIKVSNATTIHI